MNTTFKKLQLQLVKGLCELASHVSYALYNACDTFFFNAIKRGDDEKAADWNARAQGYLCMTNLFDNKVIELDQRIHEVKLSTRVTVDDIKGYYNEAVD